MASISWARPRRSRRRGTHHVDPMATMKAVRLHAYGGPEALVYEDAPEPEVRQGEVRIRVRAAGVNPFDAKVRAGYMKDFIPLSFPAVLGADVAGEIDLVGPGVT